MFRINELDFTSVSFVFHDKCSLIAPVSATLERFKKPSVCDPWSLCFVLLAYNKSLSKIIIRLMKNVVYSC